MSEFIKGFSRGLGYGMANIVLESAEIGYAVHQANKINNIRNNTTNGYLRQSTKLGAWFWVIVVLTLPYVIIWLPIYGIIRLNKKTTKISYTETIPTNIPDRRYNCGYRTEKVTQVKSKKVEATDEEIQIYKKQGKWMIITFVILFIFSIIISFI